MLNTHQVTDAHSGRLPYRSGLGFFSLDDTPLLCGAGLSQVTGTQGHGAGFSGAQGATAEVLAGITTAGNGEQYHRISS